MKFKLSMAARVAGVAIALAGATFASGESLALGAHRGGMGEYPENTLLAFVQTAARYPEMLLEGDLRLTLDGKVVLLHDATVERTTDGAGAVSAMSLDAVKVLDAGYRFTPDNGATFPFRGKGAAIPTLDEVLTALPDARFLLELKDGEALPAAAAAVLEKHGASGRVTVASFKPGLMNEFRKLAPEVAVCFDTVRALTLFNALRAGDWSGYTPDAAVLSLSVPNVERFALTPEDFGKIRTKGIHVQVHTINDTAGLERVRAMGVDSVLTDYPSRLSGALAPGR